MVKKVDPRRVRQDPVQLVLVWTNVVIASICDFANGIDTSRGVETRPKVHLYIPH